MEKLQKVVFRSLLKVKGFRLNIVISDIEDKKVIAFANTILSEEGYPDDYLRMLERYYPNSVTFTIHHKKKLNGSLRLIDPEGPCRILDFWNINFPKDIPLNEFREMGSLVIDPHYREKSRWSMTALLDIAYDYSRKNNIKYWFASAYQEKFEKFKLMNHKCQILNMDTPTQDQLTYRNHYNNFFESAKEVVVFFFDLKGVSYSLQFKRMLFGKLKRS